VSDTSHAWKSTADALGATLSDSLGAGAELAGALTEGLAELPPPQAAKNRAVDATSAASFRVVPKG
jgi:hypothetical protein